MNSINLLCGVLEIQCVLIFLLKQACHLFLFEESFGAEAELLHFFEIDILNLFVHRANVSFIFFFGGYGSFEESLGHLDYLLEPG